MELSAWATALQCSWIVVNSNGRGKRSLSPWDSWWRRLQSRCDFSRNVAEGMVSRKVDFEGGARHARKGLALKLARGSASFGARRGCCCHARRWPTHHHFLAPVRQPIELTSSEVPRWVARERRFAADLADVVVVRRRPRPARQEPEPSSGRLPGALRIAARSDATFSPHRSSSRATRSTSTSPRSVPDLDRGLLQLESLLRRRTLWAVATHLHFAKSLAIFCNGFVDHTGRLDHGLIAK